MAKDNNLFNLCPCYIINFSLLI
uniref:Uncharacterized protein n=1 Tax=Tetranychus urticae TaxID=32264 RepID=T1JU96_TETUR